MLRRRLSVVCMSRYSVGMLLHDIYEEHYADDSYGQKKKFEVSGEEERSLQDHHEGVLVTILYYYQDHD